MLLKNDGFFLVELLLSLTIWLVITSGLVPIYIHLSKQTMDIEKELEATHLLYELLQRTVLKGSNIQSEYVNRGGFNFLVQASYGQEVCVQYENRNNEPVQICDKIE
ncbi:hypothetical protein SM124_04560 (plasmid) [Bacillus sp. 31A1R]|uniref:Uncharacterized protein n=1 Tax=Robertmurraya mangrovi TaxID=3098077 RepID=A0ABU5IV56_9BACI|nr:hypothetical protein [Bacillus sp. 31A1R]MDZ5471020.1 hypothetical protein [Bacillus sp. 31A1R]